MEFGLSSLFLRRQQSSGPVSTPLIIDGWQVRGDSILIESLQQLSRKELCRQLRWLILNSSSYPQLALWARRMSPASLAYAIPALVSPVTKICELRKGASLRVGSYHHYWGVLATSPTLGAVSPTNATVAESASISVT